MYKYVKKKLLMALYLFRNQGIFQNRFFYKINK